MKTNTGEERKGRCRVQSGATLVELAVSVSVASLVVLAVLSSHIMGLRLYSISATRLSASAGARVALNNLRDDIRSAKMLFVGKGTEYSFSKIPIGSNQVGNAVMIFPTPSTNIWVRYFLDATTQTLRRAASAEPTHVVASYITNRIPFQAETQGGTVLTNDSNHRVVRMLLEFYQWEFPVAKVGGHYDYYRLQTRVTRRAIE